VFCQLEKLRRCLPPRIRQARDELPETLDEAYERTLLDIDKDNWAYAHRLFQCIMVARRPLRFEELAGFFAFKSREGGRLMLEEDWRPEDQRDTMLSTCSSLIAFVNIADSPVRQFSHFSVKEYLTSNRITEGRGSDYYIPLEPAHLFVTQACLHFATTRQTRDQSACRGLPTCSICWSMLDKSRRIRERVITGRRYDQNVIRSQKTSFRKLGVDIRYDFGSIASPANRSSSSESSNENSLYTALEKGHSCLTQLLLKHCVDPNARGVGGQTLLHVSSRDGDWKVAWELLQLDVDITHVTIKAEHHCR
jgi:hypothetical protein